MYRLAYQFTHDIDWFCKVNGVPVHIASNGGHLPYDTYTVKQLVPIQHRVANLTPQFKFGFNTDFLSDYLERNEFYPDINNMSEDDFMQLIPEGFEMSEDVRALKRPLLVYGWSFIEMARRGFFSFDRDYANDEYHLVAWPIFNEKGLPQDLNIDLKEYNMCCFPPFHENYGTDFPKFMRFHVQDVFHQFEIRKR